ncbi:MAG: PxKF domain-containing protein, partial [Casimicrobiaceae bacterium]
LDNTIRAYQDLATRTQGGTLVWVRLIADNGGGQAIAVDAANGVYVTGGFSGTADLGNGKVIQADLIGLNDVFVAKYDSISGIAQWATAAGGTGDEQGLGIAVAGTGVYVTGAFTGSAIFGADTLVSQAGMNTFVAKFDSLGNPVWARRAGGTIASAGSGIRVDSSGNSYIAGGFGVVLPNGAFGRVAKYDDSGNQVWVAPVAGNLFGEGIAIDAAGNSYVTGTYFGNVAFYAPGGTVPVLTRIPPTDDNHLFVAKYDISGNLKSLQEASGAGRAWGQGIAVAAGNSYVTGFFEGTVSFASLPPLATSGSGDFDILRAKLSNGASGATHFLVSAPPTATAGIAFNFTVTALDGGNNPVPDYAGIVHFTSSDGNATLPDNSALTAGMGSFSATLQAGGIQTITATDTSIGSVTGPSGPIAVSSGSATRLAFFNVPPTVRAGVSFPFVVKALDAYGNVAASFAGPISLASDRPFLSFSCTPLASAEWTCTGTLLYAAPQLLTATGPGRQPITGTTTITVTGGPATKLRVIAPLTATAGVKLDFSVTALDAYNNPAVGYAGTVHITSNDPGAILPADATLSSISATFSAILNTAGARTIVATDIAVPTITGVFNAVSVSGFAAPTPVGNNVTVQPIDPATGFVQPISVTFASVSAPGGTSAVPRPTIAPPANFSLKGTAYDITTTAKYTPPVTVCFTGSFTLADWILHYENGAWVQLPNRQLLPSGPGPYTTICADTTSLSPFGVFVAQSNRFAFQGFFPPIEMPVNRRVVWNTITAGQAVAVKWKLTLNATPVSDPASFAGLWSYPVSCNSGGGSGDAINEPGAGNPGLLFNGGGNWQFNWQTAASYQNTCRAIVAKFGDGTTSPAAFFNFR